MRADRLVSILLLLQAHGRMSAGALADHLEVSRRTIYRDLDSLSTAGVPVVTDRGPNGGASLLDGYRTDLTGMTEAELEVLLTFGGQDGPADELGLRPELDQASRKLAVAAGPRRGGRLQERVLIDGERWWRSAPVPRHLARIQDALWSDRRLRLRYRRAVDRVVDRTVAPYGLVCKAGTWYLLANVDGQTRVYRISRVEDAEILDETFVRPAGFDLRAAWTTQISGFRSAPPQRVRVRVDPAVSAVFTRVVGEHAVGPAEEGIAVLEFPACDVAVGLLAGFGGAIEVLEPRELRERLARIGRQLADLYESGPGAA